MHTSNTFCALAATIFTGMSALTVAQAAPFPASTQIAGEWDGIFQCDGYTTQFTIDIQNTTSNAVTGSLERSIIGPTFKSLRQPYEKKLGINGQYDAQIGAMVFGTGGGRQQELLIKGIVSPDGQRMTGSAQWARGGNCGPVIMGKKFAGEIKNILSRAKPKSYRPKVDPRAACEANVENWISQPLAYEQYSYQMRNAGAYASLALFDDKRFKPFFGKSFAKMSTRDIVKLENQVARSCWAQLASIGDNAKTASGVLRVLRQQSGSTVDVQIFPYASDTARVWQAHAVASVNPNNAQELKQLTSIAGLFTQVLWPEGAFDFTAQVADRKSAVGSEQMSRELAALLSNTEPSFEDIETAVLFERRFVVGYSGAMESPTRVTSLSRQELDARRQAQRAAVAEQQAEFVVSAQAAEAARQEIREYANSNAVLAAERYAARQLSPEQVQANLLAVSQRSNKKLGAYLSSANADRVNRIFAAQRDRQAAQFAEKEMHAYPARKAQAGDGLGGLAALNHYFLQLQNRYGALLSLRAFEQLRITAARDRQALLQQAQPQLLAQLQRSNTVAAMQNLLASSVLPEDQNSTAFAPVQQALAVREKQLAPFTDYPGATYLNALYAGDLQTIDTIDKQYRERFKQSMREMGGGGVFSGIYELAIDQIRLVEPAMAVYLLNYQKMYGHCLRTDAASFTVTTTVPTVTTTNLLGVEIARSEGYTINSSFKVNKEFETTFRKVGTMKPNDFLASMVDRYLGNGGITAVNQGIRRIMNNYDCNSTVVERMEDRMRAVFHR